VTLHPRLRSLVEELEQATGRLRALAATTPEAAWAIRPDPDRWSIGECVAHLNLTSEAFLPPLRDALASAPTGRGAGAGLRLRRDPLGWLIWRTMGPPVRIRVRTSAGFVPQGDTPAPTLIATFEGRQRELIACVHAADGRDLHAVRIPSPFDPRVRYNLYSALSILPRHQHRHLWQAEQVRRRLGSEGP
jgi:hypothetical protein